MPSPYEVLSPAEISELEAWLASQEALNFGADAYEEEQRAIRASNEASDDDWYQEVRACQK